MNRINAFNRRIAEKITSVVSTMWAAYLPSARPSLDHHGRPTAVI